MSDGRNEFKADSGHEDDDERGDVLYSTRGYIIATNLRRLSEQFFYNCAKIYWDLLYSFKNMKHVCREWTPYFYTKYL